ncbi:hypothetical protein R3Q08_13480 [Rhodococcus erythropolis]|uniref:hypothetical protein n=1 Tax=Rhodococcus TaxID=1827 RepID=UPI0022CD6253|nr:MULTISPECIES: hypothetical protein [Rhodococcus]MCZ9630325.1 hypothetical protein [Rhodococcus sp. BH5]MDV6209246.1 hypothetical protein [Rhodococcus erythropolis]
MILTRLAIDKLALSRQPDVTEPVDRDVITPRLLTAVQAGEFLGGTRQPFESYGEMAS